MERPLRVGIVCNANITRSLMGQVMINALVDPNKLLAVSAGINNRLSLTESVPVTTLNAIERLGYSPPIGYRPQPAEREFVDGLDRVFPVGPTQLNALRDRFPDLADRIVLLTEYSRLKGEKLIDPSSMIKDAPLPGFLRGLPQGVKGRLYSLRGSVDQGDRKAVVGLLAKTGLQVERHVLHALDHMIEEGLITRADIRVGNHERAVKHFQGR